MIERFTIRDTEAGFAAWLQAYGRAIAPAGYTYAAGDYPDRSIRHGALDFAIVQESPERLTATVEIGETASDELKAYLAALAVAIRKRYGGALKKPGRKPHACNRWAEDQARQGKTVKDIWPEYCDRYKAETGDDADSMVSLRKDLGDRMRKATGDKYN